MVKSRYRLLPGEPFPYGSSRQGSGVNFSLPSTQAQSVVLCLHDLPYSRPKIKIPLNPTINRTGHVWHIYVDNLPERQLYSYLVTAHGKKRAVSISDPYCQDLDTHTEWGKLIEERYRIISRVKENKPFDWERTRPLKKPLKDLIIYEMHIRGFTQDKASQVKHPGSFLGLIEKVPYLKKLGVNAVELLPIFEFNECENPHETLYNFWGYSTVNFFTPMRRYGSKEDFKKMVRTLHKEGIEVILDVVYNHTAEGGKRGPTYSFKGLDKGAYYLLTPQGDYYNFSGCGNTMNCNHAITRNFILASLRYWATEMHVDGFRFDLASIFTRSTDQGIPINHPPLVEAIVMDPVLKDTKLIAEAWDAAGLYQIGSFPAHMRFAEWNGAYRDTVRSFIKGSDTNAGEFATRISGSEDLYRSSGRSPYHSINFITAHDGFTLHDLVSYQEKHNESNHEDNQDGTNDNRSWNCGVEGETDSEEIIALRERQMRNYLLALFVSQGVPMFHMGDEYGHSKQGNNNTYCHDSPLNWLDWKKASNSTLFRYTSMLISMRKESPSLRQNFFLSEKNISWHGEKPLEADWERFLLAFQLHHRKGDFYCCFNAENKHSEITLPSPPKGQRWHLVISTANKSPEDIFSLEQAPLYHEESFSMIPYSALLLFSKESA